MLQEIVDWIFYSVLNLDRTNAIIGAINYFVLDVVKLIIILFLMITAIGILRTYLPLEQIKKWAEKKGIWGNIFAAIFGAVTPFCSCSSIPIFIGFLKSKIPIGVAFSFLITSPIINEYLVVLMLAFFGWKIALAYVISGLLIGIFAGLVIGKIKNINKYIEKDISSEDIQTKSVKIKSFWSRVIFGFNEAKDITSKIWLWILVGVGVGAIIHNFVPQSVINSITNSVGIFAVPLAVLIGVPLYGNCAAIVPIAVELFQKGVSLGTALAFMMAISALSLPEAIILRRVLKLKLILIFFGIVILSIIITGYLFNFLQVFLI